MSQKAPPQRRCTGATVMAIGIAGIIGAVPITVIIAVGIVIAGGSTTATIVRAAFASGDGDAGKLRDSA
jgi:hypothetical protein